MSAVKSIADLIALLRQQHVEVDGRCLECRTAWPCDIFEGTMLIEDQHKSFTLLRTANRGLIDYHQHARHCAIEPVCPDCMALYNEAVKYAERADDSVHGRSANRSLVDVHLDGEPDDDESEEAGDER